MGSAWTAVVMKKSRCPPHSKGCDKPHMNFAVPGFDHLGYSKSNVCGSYERSDTYISKHHSSICGAASPKQCNCDSLPSNTPEQRVLKDGCLLFIERVRVGSAFGQGGVISLYDNSST